MSRSGVQRALLAASLALAPAGAAQEAQVLLDPDDAALRRTDPGNNGLVPAAATLPDVLQMTLCAWQPFNATNPYAGTCVSAVPNNPGMFKLELTFEGLVNPPGTLGFSGQPYSPYQFGPSPVYGFLDIDVDENTDSGGDVTSSAGLRYLGNVGRFGRRPTGAIGWRAAPTESVGPEQMRSGGDFALTFCGCFPVTIAQHVTGNTNSTFEAGETWLVRGRFFQRTSGYTCASTVFGGSGTGTYDPFVNVRFSHDAALNQTTVTLVYATNQFGAGVLLGLPLTPPINFSILNNDPSSVHEGLNDVKVNAPLAQLLCPATLSILFAPWITQFPENHLDPARWDVRGIFGTAYAEPEPPPAYYAWTDTVFVETPGDMNTDGLKTAVDRAEVIARIAFLDGSSRDCDGVVNGSVMICNYGAAFELWDVTGDGVMDCFDVGWYCPGDFNRDGVLNQGDFGAFQSAVAAGNLCADMNRDGQLTVADFGLFQAAFQSAGGGCF